MLQDFLLVYCVFNGLCACMFLFVYVFSLFFYLLFHSWFLCFVFLCFLNSERRSGVARVRK